MGHTWYEETPHSKPKKAEPQQKLLEFPVIVLSNKVQSPYYYYYYYYYYQVNLK